MTKPDQPPAYRRNLVVEFIFLALWWGVMALWLAGGLSTIIRHPIEIALLLICTTFQSAKVGWFLYHWWRLAR